MKDQELRFAGSVPASYERLMVPLIFQPYAKELARRAPSICGRRESSKRRRERASSRGRFTKFCPRRTSLPPTSISRCSTWQRRGSGTACASCRPMPRSFPSRDASFDLVVCQFGAMFFPDRVRAHSEAHRVLSDGGHYLLAIWDAIERSPLTEVAQQVLIDLFPDDPPLFMREGPFSYSDPTKIEADLHEAGFETVDIETVEKRSRSLSAHDAATALCYGTPMGVEVDDREPGSLDRVFAAVEQAFRRFEGPNGIDAPMSAHIVTATR